MSVGQHRGSLVWHHMLIPRAVIAILLQWSTGVAADNAVKPNHYNQQSRIHIMVEPHTYMVAEGLIVYHVG
jgi:hypothetical protein